MRDAGPRGPAYKSEEVGDHRRQGRACGQDVPTTIAIAVPCWSVRGEDWDGREACTRLYEDLWTEATRGYSRSCRRTRVAPPARPRRARGWTIKNFWSACARRTGRRATTTERIPTPGGSCSGEFGRHAAVAYPRIASAASSPGGPQDRTIRTVREEPHSVIPATRTRATGRRRSPAAPSITVRAEDLGDVVDSLRVHQHQKAKQLGKDSPGSSRALKMGELTDFVVGLGQRRQRELKVRLEGTIKRAGVPVPRR